MTIRRMRIACRITMATHPHTICNIYSFSAATVVAYVTFTSNACSVPSCTCLVQCIIQQVMLLTGSDGIAKPVMQGDESGRLHFAASSVMGCYNCSALLAWLETSCSVETMTVRYYALSNDREIDCKQAAESLYDVNHCALQSQGPDYSIGTATAYELDGPGIESRWRRDFPHLSRLALRPTQPPVQWVPGLSRPGGKVRPGRDADPSPLLVQKSKIE
jgi:hypothetical protein